MAERCIAGEFEGSATRASHDPESIRLGIKECSIRYHMGKIGDPAVAAARAAERARVATETGAAEAARVPVQFVFVERAGARPASAAVKAAIGVIESQIGVRVQGVAKHAREEASTALQSELEDEAERREALETELEALKLRDATQRLELRASTARIAALEAKLARTSSSAAGAAAAATAAIGAAKEDATAARGAARLSKQSLARAQGRVEALEAKSRAPSSSSTGAMTWTEDEVEEFERHIGDLTRELNVLKRDAKSNAAEYARNKAAVANMRDKFAELQAARNQLRAARAEIEDLKAALVEERANPLPGFKVPLFDIRRDSDKRGAPYCEYWGDTIAPAMLNTGSTPEQINEIIRKPQLNYHPLALAHPHPPTHTHFTHTLFVGLYELRFYKPYESPTDLPSVTWWLERRGVGGVQAEAFAWARVAMATKILQGGFDETQIDSKRPHEFSLCRITV